MRLCAARRVEKERTAAAAEAGEAVIQQAVQEA
jgi:hypothetical protein